MTTPAAHDQTQQRLTDLEELTADLTNLVERLVDDRDGLRPATLRGIAADADPYAPITASRRR